MDDESVYGLVRERGIVAIVRGVEPEAASEIAESLYAGGIRLLEVTCNTAGFGEMIAMLGSRMAGRMVIGAGTVTTAGRCEQALAAGAEYMVAPDTNAEVIRYCVERDIAVFPGGQTATEILAAARLGARIVKVFPASAVGPGGIRQLRGPIDDVDFLAVGGVNLENMGDFIGAGCIGIAIGGSVIRKEIVARRDWARLTAEASAYVAAMNALRK